MASCTNKEITINNYMDFEYNQEEQCYEAIPGGLGGFPEVDSPSTGDSFDMWFWVAVLIAGALVLALCLLQDFLQNYEQK